MTRRYATRDAVLTYLRSNGEPRPIVLIVKYMRKTHKVGAGATREQLRRLLKAGVIRHPARGFYQWGDQ